MYRFGRRTRDEAERSNKDMPERSECRRRWQTNACPIEKRISNGDPERGFAFRDKSCICRPSSFYRDCVALGAGAAE